jgi:hypothetical protein
VLPVCDEPRKVGIDGVRKVDAHDGVLLSLQVKIGVLSDPCRNRADVQHKLNPIGPISPYGCGLFNENHMTKIKTTTMHLALRAEALRPDEPPFFGHFKFAYPSMEERTLALRASRYAYVGTPLCLQIWSQQQEDGGAYWEPFCDLTKNIRPNDCTDEQIIVKMFNENEPLREPLLKTGFFEDTGIRIQPSFAELEVWRLTPEFLAAFDAVVPNNIEGATQHANKVHRKRPSKTLP